MHYFNLSGVKTHLNCILVAKWVKCCYRLFMVIFCCVYVLRFQFAYFFSSSAIGLIRLNQFVLKTVDIKWFFFKFMRKRNVATLSPRGNVFVTTM